jgi:hypothetical protein
MAAKSVQNSSGLSVPSASRTASWSANFGIAHAKMPTTMTTEAAMPRTVF